MTQATNPSIATGQTGTAYRTQDNDRYAAALTQHSGSTRPSYAAAGTLWLDTSGTPWILKMYDGADDVSIGTVNASTNAFNASNAASTGSTIAMTAAINEAGATVASASTCDIGAAAGNYISVTGVTTITALGTVQTGTRRTVRFADILTLTHNGTSLILPGAANIITAAGDVAVFVSLGSGNWSCAGYVRAASSVSTLTAGTSANNLVQLDGSAKLSPFDINAAQTLTKPVIGAPAALTVSANAVAVDLSRSNNFTLALQATTGQTLSNPTNAVAGLGGVIAITQNATPSTLAFGSYWIEATSGTAPAVSTTASAPNLLSYYVFDSTHVYYTLNKHGVT